ncbi:MAG: hypothetical protein JXR83_18130 [Deltaproteobacteria bacterium]|nr:hypothetical protein [Deltaproteobacteria bacterium]
MVWALAGVVLALLAVGVAVVWSRRRPPPIIELGIGATRRLRLEERERADALVREVRAALKEQRAGAHLPDVDAFPLTDVRASRDHPDCYQVRFRRQITYVPLGDARPSAFSIDWGPPGSLGSSATEIARDHGAQAPVVSAAPQRSEEEALAFIDRCMREQGDFGVYGDVRDGLTDLHPNLTVEIFERPESYWVSITPEDGHGHFLKFSVDRSTGAVGQPMAGHLERRDLDEED